LAWTVSFEPRAFTELSKIDRKAQRKIIRFLQERVAGSRDPRQFGKPLKGEKAGLWRYRIGDYRVVSQIQDERSVVLVLRVGHRGGVYR
jgi:mRNA interferase RelE/StbE